MDGRLRPETESGLEIAILVPSCDRFSDLWAPFFEFFWRNWPDCPFPVFLGSNALTFPDPRVHALTIGADLSWASGVRSMLERVGARNVIILLDDVFLVEKIDTAAILRLVETARANAVDCLRLTSSPPQNILPTIPVPEHEEFGIVEPGTLYRITAGPAVWRVSTLMSYLIPGLSAWEFELLGTQISDSTAHTVWGPFEPFLVYCHAVVQGRYRPEAVEVSREAGVALDLAKRPPWTNDEIERAADRDRQTHSVLELKYRAMDAFRAGDRRVGLRSVAEALRAQPTSWHLWAILTFGIAGPGAMAWLRRRKLQFRIRQARNRFAAAQAQHRGPTRSLP
jgi:hypothetical protein